MIEECLNYHEGPEVQELQMGRNEALEMALWI